MSANTIDMSASDLKVITDSYNNSLYQPQEPKILLPEETKSELSDRMAQEEQIKVAIDQAITTDIGNDQSDDTILKNIPQKDSHNTMLTMNERFFDSHLYAKKTWLISDLKRLREKYLSIVDTNIQQTTLKQKEITSYDSLILAASRSARSYLTSVRTRNRSKKAGRKAGNTSQSVV